MKRGEVFVVADPPDGDFLGRPRPAVIVQSDNFNAGHSITVCPITSQYDDAQLIRLPLMPSAALRLAGPSWIAVDKVSSIRRDRMRQSLGFLSGDELVALNRSLAVFLGFA